MKKSRVFTLGLACFLTAVTTFGTLVATTGGGRFLANSNDKSSINTNDSLSFKSGFNPETDPVVYTTDYGLEIRYANDFTNSRLAGFTYFTMGEYGGEPLNWVIIGYDPSMREFVGDFSGKTFRDNPIYNGDQFTQLETIDGSSAGVAILKDIFAISSEAEANYEIGEGCVLCLSEYVIETSSWAASQYTTQMYFSNPTNLVRQKCAAYYDEDKFQFGQRLLLLQEQTLTQTIAHRINGYSAEYNIGETDLYFFPLGTGGGRDPPYPDETENFKYYNYLSPQEYTCNVDFFGRSNSHCDHASYFTAMGTVNATDEVNPTGICGIRPAFVLEL